MPCPGTFQGCRNGTGDAPPGPDSLAPSLLCQMSQALCAAAQVSGSKNFCLTLPLLRVFSLGASDPHLSSLHCSAPAQGLQQPQAPRAENGAGWPRLPGATPGISQQGDLLPGHPPQLWGLFAAARVRSAESSPADTACINFAAVWCINTVIINYYKSFL